MRSSAGGTARPRSPGSGGSSLRIAVIVSAAVSRANARRPRAGHGRRSPEYGCSRRKRRTENGEGAYSRGRARAHRPVTRASGGGVTDTTEDKTRVRPHLPAGRGPQAGKLQYISRRHGHCHVRVPKLPSRSVFFRHAGGFVPEAIGPKQNRPSTRLGAVFCVVDNDTYLK